MLTKRFRPTVGIAIVAFIILFTVMLAFISLFSAGNDSGYWTAPKDSGNQAIAAAPVQAQAQNATTPAVQLGPVLTPTPDEAHSLPPLRMEPKNYVIQAGDSLGSIARENGVSVDMLVQENSISNPDLISVGQGLVIPAPTPSGTGPSFKVIPDSELVYGPASASFDIAGFLQSQGGFLASYYEEVDGVSQTGAQVIQRVADDFSVNPRLLLAVLEYQSGWVTKRDIPETERDYPVGLQDQWRKGLYKQTAWAANQLNRGFYLWRVNGVAAWLLADSSLVAVNPTINAGTAGVQNLFSGIEGRPDWERAVSESGLFATYVRLFGYPFNQAVEPLLPPDLAQPTLQLPFEPGKSWAFTGGPHGGWADGSAWAALDFAPPGDALGCVQSDDWVTAMADGQIVRTGNGAVIQDLDGDGLEQTGWSVLYMHIETRDRVQPGTFLKAGDRVGHPSCEGGVSSGTHTHLARKYNGEWIPADQDLPFVLDGWVSHGNGYEYDGTLTKDGQVVEAYAGRSETNGIQR